MLRPLISIGITTYKRRDLLEYAIKSLLTQDYKDYEVIIGNDCVDEKITYDDLKIRDERIRIINNNYNLGEAGNINNLISLSRGQYFTCQADDDFYHPQYLEMIKKTINNNNNVKCIYTSFKVIRTENINNTLIDHPRYKYKIKEFSGEEFIKLYLRNKIKLLGITGVFEINYLKQLGGIKKLSSAPVAAMSEYLLIMEVGLLSSISYIDVPLIYFRAHSQSWSATNDDIKTYKNACKNLLVECNKIFMRPELSRSYKENVYGILKIIMSAIIKISARKKDIHKINDIFRYIFNLINEIKNKADRRKRRILNILFIKIIFKGILYYPLAIFIIIAPDKMHKYALRIRGHIRNEILK